jgi:hypothetical protein
VWINLPDPRGAREWLTLEPPRCDERYEDLETWPALDEPSALVEHVIGQLLFSTSFGKAPASCRDATIHWGAPADACTRGFDDETLAAVRSVLDRRRRQLEARALADELGEKTTIAEPPAPGAVVSLQCFVVDPGGTGRVAATVTEIDGEAIEIREVRVPSVRVDGAGPIEVYGALASLLASGAYAGPADRVTSGAPVELAGDDYLLTRLDALQDADPFLGASSPLERDDLLEVYPFHRHLLGFVDAFRRRYQAQRGRL